MKAKPKIGGGGGGLFDGEDEDDLFSGTNSKPSPAPVAQGISFMPKRRCKNSPCILLKEFAMNDLSYSNNKL